MGNRVAILLAGCGHADGAEITEAVLSQLALRMQGLETEYFSLDVPQLQVLNHFKQEPLDEERNVLVESARIARGQIKSLKDFDITRFDAVALPGGFGVAKNFCDFVSKGAAAQVHSDVSSVLESALNAKKPIMAVCISPALVGLVAHKMGISLQLTLGADSNDAAQAMKTLGHQMISKGAHEFLADEKNFVVSTPAYMHDTQSEVLWRGISNAAVHLAGWLKSK